MDEYTNYSMQFTHKGYGRIFVEKEEDIAKLHTLIKNMDEYEYGYLPQDLITVYNPEKYRSVYVHKFSDLDMGKVLKEAWRQDIHCFVVFGQIDQYDF
jgi:hypothetical protein